MTFEELFKDLLDKQLIEESCDGDVTAEEIRNGASDRGWFITPKAREIILKFIEGDQDEQ